MSVAKGMVVGLFGTLALLFGMDRTSLSAPDQRVVERVHRAIENSNEELPADFEDLIRYAFARNPQSQLTYVNADINLMPYAGDMQVWGQVDYWETVREFYAHGGDCEDYALAKYVALRHLGWLPSQLWIRVVWDDAIGAHAVLVVDYAGKRWALDQRFSGVMELDDPKIHSYQGLFEVNEVTLRRVLGWGAGFTR